MPSSRGSSQPRDRTQISHIAGRFFTIWATREAHLYMGDSPNPPAWTSYLKSRTVFPIASLTSPFWGLISTLQLPCPNRNIYNHSPDLLYPTSFSISVNGNLILPVAWVNVLGVVLHRFFSNTTHPVQQQSLTFPSKYMQLENQTSSHHFHFYLLSSPSHTWIFATTS